MPQITKKQETGMDLEIVKIANEQIAALNIIAKYPVNEINPNKIKTEEVKDIKQLDALLKRRDVSFSRIVTMNMGGGYASFEKTLSNDEIKEKKDKIVADAISQIKKMKAQAAQQARWEAEQKQRNEEYVRRESTKQKFNSLTYVPQEEKKAEPKMMSFQEAVGKIKDKSDAGELMLKTTLGIGSGPLTDKVINEVAAKLVNFVKAGSNEQEALQKAINAYNIKHKDDGIRINKNF